jgi:hypothetical protein
MVGMRVREQNRLQRLVEPLQRLAHRPAIGDPQQRVDGDDSGRRLDEIRVHERAIPHDGEPVHYVLLDHLS